MTDKTEITMRRLKRSRILHLSSLMATASFTLAACSQPPEQVASAPQGGWEAPDEGGAFATVADCVASGTATAEECAAAEEAAVANAPKYASQADCEQEFGEGQCQTRTEANGTSIFMPMLAGFLLGRMLSNGTRAAPSPLFRGANGLRTPNAPVAGRTATPQDDRAAAASGNRTVARGGFGNSRSSGYGG